MTTNALLAYLGIALTFSAAIFLFFGIRHPRSNHSDIVEANRELQQENLVPLAARYANIVCAALLLAVALTAELVSFALGGPAYGERSGRCWRDLGNCPRHLRPAIRLPRRASTHTPSS
jgi:hypothetical protein